MSAKFVTRRSDDDFAPPLFAYYPSRTLGFLGVVLLVFVTGFLVLAYLEIGPFTLVLPILLAIILVPLGFTFLFEFFRTPYVIGQEGFKVYKRGQWLGYPWQDVAAIWLTTTTTYHGVTQSTAQSHSCKLMFDDGSRLDLDHLNAEFLKWIEEQAYYSIVPKIQAEWDSGQPVRFGAVSLSNAGIHSGRHLLPWSDVASVNPERNESNIVIRERGRHLPWKELDGVAIPNIAAFSRLVQENIGEQDD